MTQPVRSHAEVDNQSTAGLEQLGSAPVAPVGSYPWSTKKVDEVIQPFFLGQAQTQVPFQISDVPGQVLRKMASYPPEEDRIACGNLPITHSSAALLGAKHDIAVRPLKEFCTNSQIRPAWKALYGQELPTGEELEKMSYKQLEGLLCKYQLYLDTMLKWLREDKLKSGKLYVLELVPVHDVMADSLMHCPDQLSHLLEAAKLLNLAQAGGWEKLCTPKWAGPDPRIAFSHPIPLLYTEENLRKAAELTLQSLNTGQSLNVVGGIAFPPELTTDKKTESVHIWYSHLHFLPDEIRNMKSLMELSLLANSNPVFLPETIGDLSNLTKLDVSASSVCTLPLSMATNPHFRLSHLTLPKVMQPSPTRDLSQGKLTQTEYVLQELKAKGCEITYLEQ
jgi:hypothetical protein